jgi:Ethanolamine utilization protein EutJ (predicted chaperonin)
MRLGIDFGTCYSSAALFIDGKLSPVREPSRPSEYCFPSSVCVTKKGEIVISQAAENKRLLNPQGYKNEFKRDLETGIPYALGEKSLFPEDLVAIMIQGLKKEAEKIVNASLKSVVITIPATYLSSKKQLMETAVKKAGFTEVTLLAEPVAAAIYYAEKGSLGHQLNEGDIVLVYDLGGGTFDAALIQKKGHSYELLGQPEGDKQCGGIDFDRLIGQDLKRQLNGDPALELLANKRTDNDALRAKLNFQDWCRNFKHQLSVEEEYEDLSPVGSDSYSLSREQFESMIAEYIDKSCNLCQNLVNKAGIKWERINRILLVGGSCRIPYVKKRLEQQFKRQVVAIDDPELAICFGAAIYGVNSVKAQEAERKRKEQAEQERQRLEQKRREQNEQERQRLEQKRREQNEQERHRREQRRREQNEQERQRLERDKIEVERKQKNRIEKIATYYDLIIICPACLSEDKYPESASQWFHGKSGCGEKLQIGDDAQLKCVGCHESFHIKTARYDCKLHAIDFRPRTIGHSSTGSHFASAISTAGRLTSVAGSKWLINLLENMGDDW